jgi:hypothetical protein
MFRCWGDTDMPNDREECRRAALAIERHIDLHLERLSTPQPDRTWHVGMDWSCTDGVEITYKCADGTDLTAVFRPEELKVFRTQPREETLMKILELAIDISRAQAKARNR